MAEPARRLVLPDREDARAWPAQGRWTYEDYRQLPDDGRRYEVIRGCLYMMPAPSIEHQRAVGELFWHFKRFLLEQGEGEVLMAPLDVLLPRDLAAPVQPDLVYFRPGNQPADGAHNFRGVPDLVVEVLSPGNRRLDQDVKLAAYREAGVPEVWLVDPQPRTILVLGLSDDRQSYREVCRAGKDGAAASRVLPGLQIAVRDVFPR